MRRKPAKHLAAALRISEREAELQIKFVKHVEFVRRAAQCIESMARAYGYLGPLSRLRHATNRETEERQRAREWVESSDTARWPDGVRDCILDALAQRAPGRPTLHIRDLCVAHAVETIARECGLKPTRNAEEPIAVMHPARATAADATRMLRMPSACSIVAEALRELGIGMDERAVQEVWEKSWTKREVWDPWRKGSRVT